MNKNPQIYFIYFLVLIAFSFFDAQFLTGRMILYFRLSVILFVFSISVPHFFQKPSGFIFPVQLILISILVSVLMAVFTWEQSIKNTLLATIPFLLFSFFFYLNTIKVQVQDIEKIILVYGIIYLILYSFQLAAGDKLIFGSKFQYSAYIIRLIFPGGGIFYLTVFMALSKIDTLKHKRTLWVIFIFLGVLVPFLQATRQFIAGVCILFLYHFIKDVSIFKKVIIMGLFLGFLYFVATSDLPVIKEIAYSHETTMAQGTEYIRIVAGTYFIKEFSPKTINKILGNGVPLSGTDSSTSAFGRYTQNLAQIYGYYLADVGLIAIYVMFGIFGVLGYILIWINSFVLPVPKEYLYVKYYLWFLLITSLTSDTIYSKFYLLPTVFAIYIFQSVSPKLNNNIF